MEVDDRWQTKYSWGTGYSADSVEWCPVPGYTDVMVCGTYQLREHENQEENKKQKRVGRIYLFIITSETTKLQPVQTIETSGILDQKWCYHKIKDYPVLAVVTSTGNIQLYQLTKSENSFSLKLWTEESVGDDVLALSLDWSSNKLFVEAPSVLVSDSSGSVSLWRLEGLNRIGVWNAHGFEAWIAAFNYWDPNIFYSGGDDSLLKCFDTRVPEVPVCTNKSHDAGVTAIRSHMHKEYQMLTGSYDEKVRLWDTRRLKSCVTEENVKGGVWRLKWNPFQHDTVLAACMYAGFRILRLGTELGVVSEYLEHESIAYGADWKSDECCQTIATCSFYDCKLNISEFRLNRL